MSFKETKHLIRKLIYHALAIKYTVLSFEVSGHFIKQLIFISSDCFGDYVPYFCVTAYL